MRHAMEMIEREGRDRGAGDERRGCGAGDERGAPMRASPDRTCLAKPYPVEPQEPFIEGDEPDDRRERHLDHVEQRFRRHNEDRERGKRDVPHREGGPVERDRHQDDAHLDPGANRRHGGAREREIEGCGGERGGRRPFLDR
jgi:hypothetical protein